jgi:hypothetical protein
LPYRVVEHGTNDIVAVCDETRDTIPLTKTDLIVHEVDRVRLASRLADAFALERDSPPEKWDGQTIRLGWFASNSGKCAAFLTFPHESADADFAVAKLIADGQAPFILVCPTRRWLRRDGESVLRAKGCVFIALADSVVLTRAGELQLVEPLDRLISCWTAGAGTLLTELPIVAKRNSFRWDGEIWTITFLGTTTRPQDRLGLKAIAHLISKKRCQVSSAVLKAVATGNQLLKAAPGIEFFDSVAKDQYKAEIEDLLFQKDEAQRNNDFVKQERVQAEIHALGQHLATATGLGGRTRKSHDPAENARISLTNAISRTIEMVHKKDVDLARHLDNSIARGRHFCYDPVPDVNWDV